MRRIGRRAEAYVAPAAEKRHGGENRWLHIWNVTNIRAREWARRHHNKPMHAVEWNALWERVRDELYGVAWACDQDRSPAAPCMAGEGVLAR
jgi:hypothetical protein